MEQKEIIFELSTNLEFKSQDNNFYFEGYLSTPDLDRVNDVVTEGCLDDMVNQITSGHITGGYEHDWRKTGERKPISRIVEAKRDKKGVWVKGLLNKAHPDFTRIWEEIKNGFLPYLSIEYKTRPEGVKFIDKKGTKIRVLDKIDLVGYGHTSIPVNPNCSLTDTFVKSLEAISEVKNVTEEKVTPTVTNNEKEDAEIVDTIKEAAKEEILREQALQDKEKTINELKVKIATFEKQEQDRNLELKVKEEAKKAVEALQPVNKVKVEEVGENRLAFVPYNFHDAANAAMGVPKTQ